LVVPDSSLRDWRFGLFLGARTDGRVLEFLNEAGFVQSTNFQFGLQSELASFRTRPSVALVSAEETIGSYKKR